MINNKLFTIGMPALFFCTSIMAGNPADDKRIIKLAEAQIRKLVPEIIRTDPNAKGPKGDTGAQGPQGPVGNGPTLSDSASPVNTLGTILSYHREGFYLVLTSSNNVVVIRLDGNISSLENSDITTLYSSPSCQGAAAYYENIPPEDAPPEEPGDQIDGRLAYTAKNTVYKIRDKSINNNSTSVNFEYQSYWTSGDETCHEQQGIIPAWPLSETTYQNIGLPANGITAPLLVNR